MRLKTILASLIITVAAVVGVAAPVSAINSDTHCVQGTVYWPTTGQTVSSNGSQRSITLNFQMTQTQLNALVCNGGYLKVDFVTQNSGLTSSAPYDLSTNVPGAIEEVVGSTSPFTPGATAIAVSGLNANYPYYVTVTWTGGNSNATFTADWVKSHWASQLNAYEKQRCNNGNNAGGWAWCVFQTGTSRHSLTGGNVALGGTYNVQ